MLREQGGRIEGVGRGGTRAIEELRGWSESECTLCIAVGGDGTSILS